MLTYGCAVWGTASKSNLKKVQTFQNKVLRIIINAPWFLRNQHIHEELGISTIEQFIKNCAEKFFNKLDECPGVVFYQLNQPLPSRRLKRTLLQDLIS